MQVTTDTSTKRPVYGILAEFTTTSALRQAAERLRLTGYRSVEAYTPFPVKCLAQIVDRSPNWVPFWSLTGGIIGATLAFLVETFSATRDYPYLVAGRNFYSWPAFIPVVFEVTILFSALFTLGALLFGTRLPKAYHPLFHSEIFRARGENSFFLLLLAQDPLFDLDTAVQLFKQQQAKKVEVLPV
jgi:hypothetical protein